MHETCKGRVTAVEWQALIWEMMLEFCYVQQVWKQCSLAVYIQLSLDFCLEKGWSLWGHFPLSQET